MIIQCQESVAGLIKGKILVGHALKNDLDVLMLSHPRTMIRDTSGYRPYMRVSVYRARERKVYFIIY
jgi:RNA exonuclease 4